MVLSIVIPIMIVTVVIINTQHDVFSHSNVDPSHNSYSSMSLSKSSLRHEAMIWVLHLALIVNVKDIHRGALFASRSLFQASRWLGSKFGTLKAPPLTTVFKIATVSC